MKSDKQFYLKNSQHSMFPTVGSHNIMRTFLLPLTLELSTMVDNKKKVRNNSFAQNHNLEFRAHVHHICDVPGRSIYSVFLYFSPAMCASHLYLCLNTTYRCVTEQNLYLWWYLCQNNAWDGNRVRQLMGDILERLWTRPQRWADGYFGPLVRCPLPSGLPKW